MIVLLNIEKQVLTLYGRKGMAEIPFDIIKRDYRRKITWKA